MTRWIALLAAVSGALLLAWTGTRTPGEDSDAPPVTPSSAAFATGRAMDDIKVIARAPHPVGSPENARVRDYLIGRMTALGLAPRVQRGQAVERIDREDGGALFYGGYVENIVGVLPGKDPSKPALALMAHYDSVPNSPGAADDATGVAVALETIRALKAGGEAPERDIIVIMTDGEEAGLLGARVFFAEHPLRERIGLLINMEARGNGGRANMFQTGPGNGEIVAAFARDAYRPISNSLAVFLYENMPNDTDFSVSKEAGVNGLNFAFIGRQFDYHAPTATIANLDEGSVRHMGRQVLAATRTLGFAPTLPGKAPDAVYSQTFGDHILAYPAWGGWILWLATAALIGGAAWRARRAKGLPWRDLGQGAAAALFLLLMTAVLLNLLRRYTGADFGFLEQRPLLAQWAVWEPAMALAVMGMTLLVPSLLARGAGRAATAVSAVVFGLGASLHGGWDPVGAGLGVAAAVMALLAFGRAADRAGAWLGALLTALVAALALQIFLPTVALIVAWPLALAAIGAAATRLGQRDSLPRIAILALLAAVGGGWLAVYFHGVAQGLDMPAILAMFAWLGGLLLWPLAARAEPGRTALLPAQALIGLGIVLTLYLAINSTPWTGRHPQATAVFHVQDRDTGKAWRVADTPELDRWSETALSPREDGTEQRAFPPFLRYETWAKPTPAIRPLDLQVAVSRPIGKRVGFAVFAERVVMVDVKAEAPITALSINGRPLTLDQPLPPNGRTTIRWQGEPGLFTLELTSDRPEAIEIRYAIVREGWPGSVAPLPARPPEAMPFNLSDSLVITGTLRPVASRAIPTQKPAP